MSDVDRLARVMELLSASERHCADGVWAVYGDVLEHRDAQTRAGVLEWLAHTLRTHGTLEAFMDASEQQVQEDLRSCVCTGCWGFVPMQEAVPTMYDGEMHPECARYNGPVFELGDVANAMAAAGHDPNDATLTATVLETAYALWRDETRTLDDYEVLDAAIALMR